MSTKIAPETGVTTAHPASTAWIPRSIRCTHCGELAREQIRERFNDDEVAVRYGCPACRRRQTRHYHDVHSQ